MTEAKPKRLTAAVVIATRNRAAVLERCLRKLAEQTRLPDEVIVVDSSDDDSSRSGTSRLQNVPYPLQYVESSIVSAAKQRNLGVEQTTGDIIVFLDDDAIPENAFIAELLRVFEEDEGSSIGGASGTITNQTYSEPRGLNRFLLGLILGRTRGTYAGQLLGPAVNFLPKDIPDTIQRVEWLPTTCTGYRRQAFLQEKFGEAFEGYSFAEDVHLSCRIGRRFQLVNTTRARIFHDDLGKVTHRDWAKLGESMVVNRFQIMHVLGRTSFTDRLRLIAYELGYSSMVWLFAGSRQDRTSLKALFKGRFRGAKKIFFLVLA